MNAVPRPALFRKLLIHWHELHNNRSLPWKGEKNAYKIWLSEIILQQTRAEQGEKYFLRFAETYPDIQSFAAAPEKELFKMWEGLGYYSRCRNMIAAARQVIDIYDGQFPSEFEHIRQLKGVGPYTAAAIASFAFNLPHAVVDGNVKRVLARFFGITVPVDEKEGMRQVQMLADECLDKHQPGEYNQSIMDFGATVCKPGQPLCHDCVMCRHCLAYRQNLVQDLPIKAKKLPRRNRFFTYLLLYKGENIFIRQRLQKDIWQGLHEFYLIESAKQLSVNDILKSDLQAEIGEFLVDAESGMYRQQLTHQNVFARFIKVRLAKKTRLYGGEWMPVSAISQIAFPRVINTYLEETGLLVPKQNPT